MNKTELFPGDKVLVFSHLLFKDDKSTPLSITLRPSTIIARYGVSPEYPDMVDIVFDETGEVSKKHFTWAIRRK